MAKRVAAVLLGWLQRPFVPSLWTVYDASPLDRIGLIRSLRAEDPGLTLQSAAEAVDAGIRPKRCIGEFCRNEFPAARERLDGEGREIRIVTHSHGDPRTGVTWALSGPMFLECGCGCGGAWVQPVIGFDDEYQDEVE